MVRDSTSSTDLYMMFFSPGNVKLSSEAQQIVRQAAIRAKTLEPSIIEIAVPPDVPGELPLFQVRVAAIENAMSVEGTDPKQVSYRPLSEEEATSVPGAEPRAEISIVQR